MIEDYETVDAINERLDQMAPLFYHSVEAIEKTIGGILNLYDIEFPGGLEVDEDNIFQCKCSGDMDTEFFLYVTIDEETVGYSVYTQILEEEDIQDIQDGFEAGDYGIAVPTSRYLLRVRHSEDDGGD